MTQAPGSGHFGAAVDTFDEAIDRALERVRGAPAADRLLTTVTHAAEFSVIWHVSSIARGLVKRRPDQIVAMAVGIGAESLVVNQGLKRLFARSRPTESGDERFGIRRPVTSSFPSGHASAAAFAATVLIGWDGKRSAPLWGTLAGLVAVSRPYVRIHHASDVVGGVVVGVAMGSAALRIFERLGHGKWPQS